METISFNKTEGNVNVLERLHILSRKQLHAALATDLDGRPYMSLVTFALTPDGEGLLFATPKKTTKYRNMLKNRNVSLLIDSRKNTPKGYMNAEAMTIMGTAVSLKKGGRRDKLSRVFISKHPALAGFINAPTTALIQVTIDKIIHAGKFQKVTIWYKNKE